MRRTCTRVALFLIATSAFAGLDGARVTVTPAEETPAVKSVTGLSYESFDEAAAFWDVEAAGRLAQRDDQRAYLAAVRALMRGDESAAESSLIAVRASSRDERVRGPASQLLGQLYFADGRWEEYRALELSVASDDPFRVLTESVPEGPAFQLVIPAEATTVRTTPDAGLPTLSVRVNGRPFEFILDTGAPFTVIDADVAEASGTRPREGRTAIVRNDVSGRPARIARLEIGGVVARDHPVLVVPTAGLTLPERPSENKTIQGILGWPIIRRLDLEIDLAGGRTTIRRPVSRPRSERGDLFFFFRPLVVARDVQGMPLHFLLDTGADGTLLYRRLGKKTELGKLKKVKLGRSRIGETTEVEEGRMLPKFAVYIGGHRVVFEKIPLLPGSFVDGLLGTDVHRQRRVRIDYTNGRYELLP